MTTDLEINKPDPIAVGADPRSFARGTDVPSTIEALEQGEHVIVTGFYSDGVTLLKELHRNLKQTLPSESLAEQHAYRSRYRELSNRVLLEVVDQKLRVKKAPDIGWLRELYSENHHFYLSFPQIQGLNSAWQWYERGISIPTLRAKLHPYYGVYFPTRYEHLVLFDQWLKQYSGPKKSAMDVGVGCGVLSLQMVQKRFQKVYATDTNPNAIVGLVQHMGTTKLARKIELDCGHLFGKWEAPVELIVFNPPWLPETHESGSIDRAIYYPKTLFPEFFAEAKKRLLPTGRLVVIFSNLAQITQVTTDHPIEKELADGKRLVLESCIKMPVTTASTKTKRDQHWRAAEEVELWVLTHA